MLCSEAGPLQVMNRAARAGELLAHVLMSGAHGDCPVTLIGNSMGARLVLWDLHSVVVLGALQTVSLGTIDAAG